MSIRWCSGSILDSPAYALVCPVNCVPGVMGAGLARAFAERWPGLKADHREACKDLRWPLAPGGVRAVQAPGKTILFVATKDHFRDPSRLAWVRDGLDKLGRKLDAHGGIGQLVSSLAVPAIGCGLGGLPWADVRPLVVGLAESRPEYEWHLYPPEPRP